MFKYKCLPFQENWFKSINERVRSEGFRSEGIVWNGRDDFGEKIGRGVYVYKLKVLNEGGEKVEKLKN